MPNLSPSSTALRDAMLKAWADFNVQWAAWSAMPRWDGNPAITKIGNTYTGTEGAERISADAGNQILYGLGGNDYLEDGDGNDKLYGGEGNDFLAAGHQQDELYGGPGDDFYLLYPADSDGLDILVENPNEGFDFIELVPPSYTLPANFEGVFMDPSPVAIARDVTGNELGNFMRGNSFDNHISGMAGDDYLEGLGGVDTLDGGADNDWLEGGDGNDTLNGGADDDVLKGGSGNDTIDGGTGIDTAYYAGNRAGYLIEGVKDANGKYIAGSWTITDIDPLNGDDGADHLTNVEKLQFADTGTLPVYTNDQIATQLTTSYWNSTGSAPHHFQASAGSTLTIDISTLDTAAQFLATSALTLWSDVTGILFQPASGGDGAQITFSEAQTGAFCTPDYDPLTGITSHALVNVGTAWLATNETTIGSYGFQTFVHEIGHALGLGHAGNYNSSAFYPYDALFANDAWATTVMSYFDAGSSNSWFADQGYTYQYSLTPMVADIIAVERLYGPATAVRTGDTTYGFNNTSGRSVYDALVVSSPDVKIVAAVTIVDGGGDHDTLDYSGFGQNQKINLNPETFSNIGGQVGNLTIDRWTVIENAIGGAGNDQLTGNAADNVLTGNGGDDTLYGGDGSDTASYASAPGAVAVDLRITGTQNTLSAGSDTLYSIENLIGSAFGDTLIGDGGNNRLDGGAGVNTMWGMGGNDTLIVGSGADGSFIDGGTGTDTLAVSGTVSLGSLAGIEAIELAFGSNLTLTTSQLMAGLAPITQLSGSGTITVNLAANVFTALTGFQGPSTISFVLNGSSGDDYIKAAHFNNTIHGGTGRDFIRGGNGIDIIDGGADNDKITGWGGADILTGGSGSDQFRYFYATDSGVGAGSDRITDFTIGSDLIDLRLLDKDLVTPDIQNYALGFIGSAAFGASGAGQIRYATSGGNMLVQFDLDGNGTSDMEIVLQGLAGQTLSVNDFLFGTSQAASSKLLASVTASEPASLPDSALLTSDPLIAAPLGLAPMAPDAGPALLDLLGLLEAQHAFGSLQHADLLHLV